MQLTKSVLVLAMAAATMAAVPAPLEQRAATSCSTPDGNGVCGSTNGVCNGFFVEGFCPGAETNQCCVPSDADPTGDAADTGDDGAEGPEADEGILPDDEAKADAGDDDDDGGEGVQARSADPEAAAAPKKPKTKGERIYAAAAKWIGTHYKWGGGNCRGPTNGGFDCSGLVLHAVCKALHIQLPHKASLQYVSRKGKHIPRAKAQRGDLLFWATNGHCKGNSIKHVGIFSKPGYFLNAPNKRSKVRVQKIWTKSGSLKICPSAVRIL